MCINIRMRIQEITGQKTRTPEQQRVAALKQQKDNASKALKTARAQQKQNKARDTLQQTQEVLALLGTN